MSVREAGPMCETRKIVRALLAWGAVAALSARVCAQDTRTVTEPKIPTACMKLQATKVYTGALWDDATEAKEDTAAVQAAIDGFAAKCQPGQAIELTIGPKGANAFLSGPIELKEGITLLVDKGVTLVASRN